MALAILSNSGKISYNIKELIADKFSDLPVEGLAAGSTAYVVDEETTYMFNSLGQWIETDIGTGGSSGVKTVLLKEGEYDPITGEPTIDNPKKGVFYFVPEGDGSSTEWIYVNEKWEKIGHPDIDMSVYVQFKDIDKTLTQLDKPADSKTVGDKLDGLDSRVSDIESNYLTSENIDTTLKIEGAVAESKTVGDKIDGLDGRISDIESDYLTSEDIDTTLSIEGAIADSKAVGDKISDINDLIDNIEDTLIPAVSDRVSTLEDTTVPAISNRVSEIEDTVIPELTDKVSTIEDTTIPGLSDKITTLEDTTIPAILDRVSTIEDTTIPGLSNKISTIEETTIPGISDRLSTVENTTIPDITDRLSTIENDYLTSSDIDATLSKEGAAADAKATKDALDSKQPKLDSSNLKTVGGQTLLGSGDIALATINGQSVVGGGNISIATLAPVVLKEGEFDPETGIPTIENPDSNSMYFTPKEDGTCYEWVYVKETWELVGNADVDLSNYVTFDDIDSTLAESGKAADAKVVGDEIAKMQPKLDDSNLKTVCGQTLLGSGNIEIDTIAYENIESVVEGYDFYLKNYDLAATYVDTNMKVFTEENYNKPFEFELEFTQYQTRGSASYIFCIGNGTNSSPLLYAIDRDGVNYSRIRIAQLTSTDATTGYKNLTDNYWDGTVVSDTYRIIVTRDADKSYFVTCYKNGTLYTQTANAPGFAWNNKQVASTPASMTNTNDGSILIGVGYSGASSYTVPVTKMHINYAKFKWLDKEVNE